MKIKPNNYSNVEIEEQLKKIKFVSNVELFNLLTDIRVPEKEKNKIALILINEPPPKIHHMKEMIHYFAPYDTRAACILEFSCLFYKQEKNIVFFSFFK